MEGNLFTICLLAVGPTHSLVQTIKSIQDQSCKDKEVLLVCSKEMTESHSFPSFVRIVHSSSPNPAAYANKAIMEAQGKYLIFFLPGEIFLFSEALAYIKDCMNDNPGHMLYQFGHIDHALTLTIPKVPLDALQRGRLFVRLCSSVISKEFLKSQNCLFEERFPHRLTFSFMCTIMRKLKEPIFFKRVVTKGNQPRLTFSQKLIYFWETFLIIQKSFGIIPGLKYLVKPMTVFQNPFKPSI